ncbi:molybdenum cofactor biosynthesis protein MoaE [soil metagenome]
MADARAVLVDRPVDAAALVAEVASPSRGAICSFVGTVREEHDGRAVTGLQYDCYEAMAVRELETIVAEAGDLFGGPAIAVEHRVGSLAVGETAVAIAAAHARRANAIGAMQYVIEELKKRLPIWKLELYADGTRAWVKGSEAAGQGAGANGDPGVAA